MTDPKRWSEGGDASELERELLVAGQSVRLPPAERRALWAGIALSLPVAPPSSAIPKAPRAVASTSGALAAKFVLFLAASVGLTFGVSRLWPRAAPTPKPLQSFGAPTARTSASVLPRPSAAPAASGVAPTAPASDPKPRLTPTSQLREESGVVLEARAALRAGDAARSLALL